MLIDEKLVWRLHHWDYVNKYFFGKTFHNPSPNQKLKIENETYALNHEFSQGL